MKHHFRFRDKQTRDGWCFGRKGSARWLGAGVLAQYGISRCQLRGGLASYLDRGEATGAAPSESIVTMRPRSSKCNKAVTARSRTSGRLGGMRRGGQLALFAMLAA